jgi:hypothetical protein
LESVTIYFFIIHPLRYIMKDIQYIFYDLTLLT